MIFHENLETQDIEIFRIIEKEKKRQIDNIELIASENYVSKAVMEAAGSILTNKYAEGYPSKRYYNGCEYVDEIENIAITRLKQLFNCEFANVQPHSGSQANQAVFLSLLNPGDTIMGMSLDSGGHLTHGSNVNLSGKWFNVVSYDVRREDGVIDYQDVMDKAKNHKPKLIICGYSAYPRKIDFAKFREIADEVGAYLLADIAHIAGLVAGGAHETPFPYAHIVTSTTHKTLRGPRGGVIMTNSPDLSKKINSAIFPGIQGGPLMHIIAAKAIAFGEALTSSYKEYIQNLCANANFFAQRLKNNGFTLQTGGTDNHLVLVDLRSKKLTGKLAANLLDIAGVTCNKNAIPFDTTSPFITSGIRMGTPACTTRGFMEEEWLEVADIISEILESAYSPNAEDFAISMKQKVKELCSKFPIY
ncbi:MAG: serine hydroxymethyltransferase [Alphaproteobacteria bacterium]|nr:serine hydroxymethyltransferase [Alphaproteobacteria bacterium]